MAEVAPDVPPQLEQLIRRCLRKNPDERWQSMKDVLMALQALKHESDSGSLYKPRIPAPPKRDSTKEIAGAVIGLVLVAGAGVGALLWAKHHKPAPVAVQVPVAAIPATPEPAAATEPNPTPAPAPEPAEAALNNDRIVEMVEAKVAPSVILSQIRSSKTDFNLSAGEVIRLSKAGVPAIVIEAMRNPKTTPATAANGKPASASPRTSVTPVSTTPVPTPAPVASTPPPAQPVAAVPAPAAPAAPVAKAPAERVVVVSLTDSAPIRITLTADVPADAPDGSPLRFVAADDFRAGDVVVIAKGSTVAGEVVEGSKKKLFGNKPMFRLTQVDAVDGHKLNIRATAARGSGGQPALHAFEGGPNAPKHSKDVLAAQGTEYIAYLEGDQTVSVKK